ncbi:hypothetical protein PIB19_12075 [Sphingomonas sp. 7/4-4]|uniref:hypothetical protein n=1 Tax=Sphingomonas sp. 7/4-4 TaxID=3018446 RepID=UPI0022F39628|nr:hypothetical protein [Sphingomonas sp. 7/4-4]WBY06352.1 hypothetical protein PIB19_12075 [Sphingomonas sp. 7/4-4]
MAEGKLSVAPDEIATAAFNLQLALMAQLGVAGALTEEQLNFVAASAASMCRRQGEENAAKLIETVVPTAVGVNINIEAMKQGIGIKRQPRD